MGTIRDNSTPAKLFFGLLGVSEEQLNATRRRLEEDFSSVEISSQPFAFTFSNYYAGEMGTNILRQWVAVTECITMPELVAIKHQTNDLELVFAADGNRKVNIDPGYLTEGKVVLATTKDYDHRLYIGQGIYEEVTLRYRRTTGFEPWPWTYPDYRSGEALRFFNQLRVLLREQISGGESKP